MTLVAGGRSTTGVADCSNARAVPVFGERMVDMVAVHLPATLVRRGDEFRLWLKSLLHQAVNTIVAVIGASVRDVLWSYQSLRRHVAGPGARPGSVDGRGSPGGCPSGGPRSISRRLGTGNAATCRRGGQISSHVMGTWLDGAQSLCRYPGSHFACALRTALRPRPTAVSRQLSPGRVDGNLQPHRQSSPPRRRRFPKLRGPTSSAVRPD